MCIIMFKDVGVDIKEEWMDNSAKSNSDGYGLSYIHPEAGLTIFRTLDYEEFKSEYKRLTVKHSDSPFILHFRKTTDGTTTVDNCHPFEACGLAVFHNGVITECKPIKGDDRSDTRIFCEEVLGGLPEKWEENDTILDLVESYIGASKVVFMNKEGDVTLLNEDNGHWHEGVWMSNYSYYPNTRSIQKYKPYSWDANVVDNNSNTGKGKTFGKTVCYRHPDGSFTKYKDGRRLRWNPANFSWYPVKNTGTRELGGPTYFNEPPTCYNYDMQSVTYGVDISGIPRVLRLPDNSADMVVCDWCGANVRKTFLKAFNWDDQSPMEETSLLCPDCQDELSREEFMVERNDINIEYLLQQREGIVYL